MNLTISEADLLYHRIERMIALGGRLQKEQVLKMFRLYGNATVYSHINALLGCEKVKWDSAAHSLVSQASLTRTDMEQQMISAAFWVLAAVGDENIAQYEVVSPPTQLLWVRKADQKLFDVTVIPNFAVKETILIWNRLRIRNILDNDVDVVDHIALTANEETGAYAVQAGGFNRYCLLDVNKEVIFSPPTEPPPDEG